MYVPVNVDKFVDKAHTRGADVIQLDLEDSVPPAENSASSGCAKTTRTALAAVGSMLVCIITLLLFRE